MIRALLKAIGVSRTFTGRLGEVEWLWARPYVLWIGLALLIPLGVYIVLRHRRNLPHVAWGPRTLLSACRIGILLLLVIVLGGPYLRLAEPVEQKPVLAWLQDASGSMALPLGEYDGPALARLAVATGDAEPTKDKSPPKLTPEVRKRLLNLTRAETLERVLVHHEGLLGALAERFDLRRWRFAGDLRAGAASSDAAADAAPADEEDASAGPDGPDRGDTNLGAALEGALADAAARPLVGIVLLTDGQSTTGPDPLQVMRRHQEVATESAGVPVWAVPVGSPTPPVDIAVVDAVAPARVARDDTAAVVATVTSHGLDGRTVKVLLLEGDTERATAEVTLTGESQQQVHLAFHAEEPGTRLLTVQAAEQGEEPVKANNRRGLAVEVDEQRWKVLYLEGYPRWDFRFLDHALRRDHGLEVTLVMEARLRGEGVAAADLPKVAGLPKDAAGLAEYNTVVLGDVTPALLPAALQEELARAVSEDGLGLIVQVGPAAMPHAFVDGPLLRLLPLEFARPEGEGSAEDGRRAPGLEAAAFAPFRMAITATGSLHPALRLYDSASRNRRVWSRMPPFYWAADTVSPAAGATVLAEFKTADGARPLVAEHFAGAGRVLVIGTDSTYRWRRNIGDYLFYRFWGQAIRRVARAKQRPAERTWMEVHPSRVERGESVAVELHAVDVAGRPLERARLAAKVSRGDSVETVLLEGTGQAGHYRGAWPAKAVGEYSVSFTDATDTTVTAAVRVTESDRELVRPAVDRDTLGSLADLSGGGMLELDALGRLADRLHGESTTVHSVHEEELWDNWLMLLALVGLYCTDVFARRMSGLT